MTFNLVKQGNNSSLVFNKSWKTLGNINASPHYKGSQKHKKLFLNPNIKCAFRRKNQHFERKKRILR